MNSNLAPEQLATVEASEQMRAFLGENRARLEGLSVKALIHEGHRL
jgi:hypothetical protein